MTPSFQIHPATLLVGMHEPMSVVNMQIPQQWQRFMSRKGEIANGVGSNLYSCEVYDDLSYFQTFDPQRPFEKWAAVAVSSANAIPSGMEILHIPESYYAVFHFKGRASEVGKAYQYIYNDWLHKADVRLENRPHFAIMGADYRPNDPSSEETLWVPVAQP